jgi:hypothetical protein
MIAAGVAFFLSNSPDISEVAEKILPICKGDGECENAVIDHADSCNEEFWAPMFNEHERMLTEYGDSAEFEQKYGDYSRRYSSNFSSEITECIAKKSGYSF